MDSSEGKSDVTHEEVLLMKKEKDDIHILDFSDCVLTLILSYLNSYDLYLLGKTCTRFKYLVKERKLWRRVNLLGHPMCAKKFKCFCKNINKSTDTVMVRGIIDKEKTLTAQQMPKLFSLCENLSVLAIEYQYINSDEVRLSQFPKNLTELSLRATHIMGKQPFLQDAHKRLTKLHTLLLDDCKWFHEHSLMALSKLQSLENLSLHNCRNLNDSVAYMSVTARFGFTKLLRIDARGTPIGDQFLKCFHCIKTLREIYLECPPSCPLKRGNIFDEIKRWCTSNMQALPNVVIFNQSTVNTVFKRNSKYSRSLIKLRNKMEASMFARARKPTPETNYNCIDNGEACCLAACTVFPRKDKKSKHKESTPEEGTRQMRYNTVYGINVRNREPQAHCSNSQNSEGSSQVPKEEIPTCSRASGERSFALPPHTSITREYVTDDKPSFDYSSSDTKSSSDEISDTDEKLNTTKKMKSKKLKTLKKLRSDKIAVLRSDKKLKTKKSKTDKKNDKKAKHKSTGTKKEKMYCDETADFEEELLEFQMFQSEVTDAGVQWFCTSDPQSVDEQGSESFLFKKPYMKCDCAFGCESKEKSTDYAKPGPSGLNLPGPSSSSPSTPRPPSNQDNAHRRLVFKRKKCRISEAAANEEEGGPADAKRARLKPSLTVDLNIGEGPLHLEIINEVTGTIERPANQENDSDSDDDASKVRQQQLEQELANACEEQDREERLEAERRATPVPPEMEEPVPRMRRLARDDEDVRNRDLRVIIERLDPGLHIVIDRAGRIQFGPMRANNYTKLKVLIARGYKMITDAALRSLAELRLELLDVTGTSVTPAGLQHFLNLNPDCRVIHESVCRCH